MKIKGLNLAPHEVHVSCGFPGRENGLKMIHPVSCLNAGGQLARNEAHRPNIQHPEEKKKKMFSLVTHIAKQLSASHGYQIIWLKVQSVLFQRSEFIIYLPKNTQKKNPRQIWHAKYLPSLLISGLFFFFLKILFIILGQK